ncbi:fimbria/pilus outer membrane usher protein [uncultured Cedecea sp.]|uniref:fimbria/pilus outer membrane usher protein n=1 Tax=uncultured Cedecea sp. TaxID=988762 RepID=UPI002609C7B2|nr:fimbria/pilus outer membrane usher protein [uncultured Cedecea sp.]
MPLRILILLLSFLIKTAISSEKTWVIFNNQYKGAIALDIQDGVPCLTRPLLQEWGVRDVVLDKLQWDASACLTSGAAEAFFFQYWYRPHAHLLTLLFPEDAISPQQNGISTSRWDDGINALFSNYRLDINKENARYSGDDSGTEMQLDLDNGVNVGPWRLRYQNTFWREKDGNRGSYSGTVSLWRNFTSLRSKLTIGDGYTNGTLFDSIPMRGISLASNEAMYPDSWRPYAPVINGYARSEAEVTIHQNGERVYRIHVPPGPFILRNFYPPDAEGNLELTIQESDGTERTRQLPYSIMPNMVGHGYSRYELTAGHYKAARFDEKERPRFWQGTIASGILSNTTLFGGVQLADNYHSGVIGLGRNMGKWGAVSLDMSRASYTQQNDRYRGSVWRLRYAKAFFRTETSLNAQLQWYRRGSRYRSLEEKLEQSQWQAFGLEDDTTDRSMRGRVELTQNFGSDSSLSLSWNWLKSRRAAHNRNSVSLSMNTGWNELDLSLYAEYERGGGWPKESTLGINVSIPFSIAGYNSNIALNSDLANRDNNDHEVNIYGSALDDLRLRYDARLGHVEHGDDNFSASLGYQYNAGEVNVGMNQSGKWHNYHADMSGSIVLHDEGFALGQMLGSTSALVQVPDTPGVAFYNQFGSTTDSSGNLLVSYMTPWRVNDVTTDSFSLPEDVCLDVEEIETVPTEGAIVSLRFPVNRTTKCAP